jgi:hypothetical protein
MNLCAHCCLLSLYIPEVLAHSHLFDMQCNHNTIYFQNNPGKLQMLTLRQSSPTNCMFSFFQDILRWMCMTAFFYFSWGHSGAWRPACTETKGKQKKRYSFREVIVCTYTRGRNKLSVCDVHAWAASAKQELIDSKRKILFTNSGNIYDMRGRDEVFISDITRTRML